MRAFNRTCHTTAFIHIDTTLTPSFYKKLIWATTLLCFIVVGSLLPLVLAYKILLGLVLLVSLWFGQIYSYHLLALSSLATNPTAKSPRSAYANFDFLEWQLQCVRGVVQVPWVSKIKTRGLKARRVENNAILAGRQAVWQAALIGVTDMGCLVILTFNLIEPQQNKLHVTVWQDQVNNDTWRQLKILAR